MNSVSDDTANKAPSGSNMANWRALTARLWRRATMSKASSSAATAKR